jgi:hypothetical protein
LGQAYLRYGLHEAGYLPRADTPAFFFLGGRTIEDCSAAGKAVIPYHACDCMVFWLSVFDN